MTNLPRRHIDPLEPPPDSFDRVLATARGRRRRRGLIAASSTMVVVFIAAASFALGASLNAMDRLDPANHDRPSDSPTPGGPFNRPAPTSSGTPNHQSEPGTGRVAALPSWLLGRAVDSNGNGIAGLYVLPGNSGQRTFNSDGRVGALTDERGNFRILCPHAPVLLSTWRIDRPYAGPMVGGSWAATFVGSKGGSPVLPRCGSGRITTTLFAGATVTGQVVETGECVPGDEYPVWLWLGGNKSNTIRLAGLHKGDTFVYSGLPAGAHTLGLRGQTKSVPVAPGAIVESNVDYSCDGSTEPAEPDPEDPPEPDPSASPTPTPSAAST